jgi:hypothetical protein
MIRNPAVLLYDANGNPVVVQDDTTMDVNQPGVVMAGYDRNANKSRFLSLDVHGNLLALSNIPTYSQSVFGETKVAPPYLIGNIVNKYNLDTSYFGTSTVGGGSVVHVPNQSSIKLSVTSANGDIAKLRTHDYYRYQAGRSLVARISGFHGNSGVAGQVRRWGFFDENNGLFWQLNGTDFQVVRRTSTSGTPVDNVVNQASFNRDTMDGNGESGVNLDLTKGNIYEIQFQWLGAGLVNFFINATHVHQMEIPNTIVGPYMRTAVLPISWEIENTSASSVGEFTFICGSVTIEGGEDTPFYSFGAYNSSEITAGTTEIPILSIRPTETFNSIENRMQIVPILLKVSNEGGRASYRVVLDGNLTGASFTQADSNSGTEFDESATALSGGTTLTWGLMPNSIDSATVDLTSFFHAYSRTLRRFAFGTDRNILTVTGKYEKSSGETDMWASFTWQEAR